MNSESTISEVDDVPITEDLQHLNKEELIARVRQLEAHVKQLKNILAKQWNKSCNRRESSKKNRDVNFSRFNRRHVALKICYLGWDYQGLAVQENTIKTIEAEVFNALLKTHLIESRETSHYHRCGRTDKGVSAFGQVISLDLRCKASKGLGVIVNSNNVNDEKEENDTNEFSYVTILNRVLPPEIRVLAWAPVEPNFSARFNCVRRMYKYYFPRGNLNIDVMRDACKHFIGEHDFRNFCKMDVRNGVVNYVRSISAVTIAPLTFTTDAYQLFELTIVGQAFLWHQIRCMVAVLFLVGQELEKPDIVNKLLDVTNVPCKPQYTMALESPLVLFDCEYEDIAWRFEDEALSTTLMHLQKLWSCHAIKSEIIQQMLVNLETWPFQKMPNSDGIKHQIQALLPRSSKIHKPLLERPHCESLEARLKHYSKRLKLKDGNATQDDTKNNSCDEVS